MIRLDIKGYGWGVGVMAAATAVGWPLHHRLGLSNTNVLMLYLLGMLWVSIRHSPGPAILSSVLGVAAFDFCFIPPYRTFAVHEKQYLITFAAMLTTALTINTLTHRMREQEKKARLGWETAESEFLRNTLLSGVSHDLRTPLSAITGAVSTLIEHGEALSPAERADMLQTIFTESEHMERLINNLLDMTRLESGSLVLKKEWHSLDEIVESVLRHLHRRLGSRPVRADLPDDLPLLEMDGVAIRQVLINLVENAVEHAASESAIEVSASADERNIIVEVRDRGPGLPPGSEERIFEKFYRDNSTPGRRGIGLGLAICRGIVEAHGGKITAANRPGGGTVVRFTLPRGQLAPAVEG